MPLYGVVRVKTGGEFDPGPLPAQPMTSVYIQHHLRPMVHYLEAFCTMWTGLQNLTPSQWLLDHLPVQAKGCQVPKA